jgi:hypothetical protein
LYKLFLCFLDEEVLMMIKKLVMLVLMLALVGSASAYDYWTGGVDSDWTNDGNWGTEQPDGTDWIDVRSDTLGTGAYPIITVGQSVTSLTIRLNPGYGAITPSITNNGGTLDNLGEMYVGSSGGPAEFIQNSGTTNIGTFTAVGNGGGAGGLYINGGTFNAGFLGMPNWYDGSTSIGSTYIDGGNVNTLGFLVGVGGNIDFTKDLVDGGGLLTDIQDLDDMGWSDWQTAVLDYVGTGLISSSAGGGIQVDFSSVDTIRTTEIYSVPEPMTMALLGVGSLLLRRRRK